MTAATRAIHLEVPADALATFDALARRSGLSRPRLFTRLMAIEAQRLRLEEDMARLVSEGETAEDRAVAAWSEATSVALHG